VSWSNNSLHKISWGVANLEGAQRHVRQRQYRPIHESVNTTLREPKRDLLRGRHEPVRQQIHRDQVRHLFVNCHYVGSDLTSCSFFCIVSSSSANFFCVASCSSCTSRACARLCSSSNSSFVAWSCSRSEYCWFDACILLCIQYIKSDSNTRGHMLNIIQNRVSNNHLKWAHLLRTI
jgi:hypothetical protein